MRAGTVTHMAPELIERGDVSTKCDVYAFGIFMWECYTRLAPYKGLKPPQIVMGVVSDKLRPAFSATTPEGYRVRPCMQLCSAVTWRPFRTLCMLTRPSNGYTICACSSGQYGRRRIPLRSVCVVTVPPTLVQDLARWCWSHDPKQRPTFSQIAKFLLLMLEDEEVKPF